MQLEYVGQQVNTCRDLQRYRQVLVFLQAQLQATLGHLAPDIPIYEAHVSEEEIRMELSTPTRAGILLPTESEEQEDLLMLVMPVMLNN